jgi:hypothetical protein
VITIQTAIVGFVIVVAIAAIGWIVNGMVGWGRAAANATAMQKSIDELKTMVVTKSDLKASILEMQRDFSNAMEAKYVTRDLLRSELNYHRRSSKNTES